MRAGSFILGMALCAGMLVGCQDRAISLAKDSGVNYEDVEKGWGVDAEEGMLVGVGYRVMLPDGEVIIDTFDQDRVHRFVLGDESVVPGLDIGVRGMKLGGVRKLEVPPRSHYGKQGYAGVVPANTTLEFEVHLLELSPPGVRPKTVAERRIREMDRR